MSTIIQPSGGGGSLRPHGTDFAPIGLWQLDGSLVDDVGSNDLVVSGGGSASFFKVAGLQGAAFTNGGILQGAAGALLLVGNMTVEFLAVLPALQSFNTIVGEQGNGETEQTNQLWSFSLVGNSLSLQTRYGAEFGPGSNIVHTINAAPIVGQPFHGAMVRSGNQVSFFYNGARVAAASVGLVAPTYAPPPAQRLEIGGASGGGAQFTGWVASVKVCATALTDAQVASEAASCLGWT